MYDQLQLLELQTNVFLLKNVLRFQSNLIAAELLVQRDIENTKCAKTRI